MGLGAFAGGLGAAGVGFQAGVRQQEADNIQQERNSLESQRIDAQKQLLPDQTTVAQQALASQSADLADKEELRPLLLDVTKAKSAYETQSMIHQTALEAMTHPQKAAAITDTVLGQIGAVAAAGDPTALAASIEQAARTPLMPALNKVPKIVSADVVPAQEGMVDVGGNPITKAAIRLKHPDGSETFLNAQSIEGPYQRYRAAIDKANMKVLKPGERAINVATGATIAEGNDRPYGGLVQDAEGNWIDMRPRTAGGAGGTGKGGKGPATPQTVAQSMLDDLFEKNGKDQPPEARARANSYLPSILRTDPNLDPGVATRIAFEAAANPASLEPRVNPLTGTIDQTFKDTSGIAGGRTFNLGSGYMKPGQVEKFVETNMKGKDGKAFMQQEVGRMLQLQPEANRQTLVDAAFDPVKYDELKAQAKGAIKDDATFQRQMQIIDNKLDLIRTYTKAPGGKPDAAKPATAPGSAPGAAPAIRPAGGLNLTIPERRVAAEKMAADNKAADAERKAAAPAKAAELLKTGSRADLAKFQASPDFDAVDKATQMQIYKRVNNI
jgi:hypothetical protein